MHLTLDKEPLSDMNKDTHDCELCEAARFTHWYYEDDVGLANRTYFLGLRSAQHLFGQVRDYNGSLKP